MNPTMKHRDYLTALRGRENDPVSIHTLLVPFDVQGSPRIEDEFLLVGHILDAIAEVRPADGMIDAVFILEVAMDLGFSL